MQNEQSYKFLSLFCELEKLLKSKINANNYTPFNALISRVSENNPFVRKNKAILNDLGDLRNILSHKVDGEIIAIPTDDAIKNLYDILEKIKKPPLIFDICKNDVSTISPEEKLMITLNTMKKNNYSQIPVYSGSNYLGLLTGNIISRFFASYLDLKGEIISSFDKTIINDLLYLKEDNDDVVIVTRKMNVFEFVESISKKPSLSGIYLITENGRTNEKPLGIITYFDYPKIYKELDI